MNEDMLYKLLGMLYANLHYADTQVKELQKSIKQKEVELQNQGVDFQDKLKEATLKYDIQTKRVANLMKELEEKNSDTINTDILTNTNINPETEFSPEVTE